MCLCCQSELIQTIVHAPIGQNKSSLRIQILTNVGHIPIYSYLQQRSIHAESTWALAEALHCKKKKGSVPAWSSDFGVWCCLQRATQNRCWVSTFLGHRLPVSTSTTKVLSNPHNSVLSEHWNLVLAGRMPRTPPHYYTQRITHSQNFTFWHSQHTNVSLAV